MPGCPWLLHVAGQTWQVNPPWPELFMLAIGVVIGLLWGISFAGILARKRD